MFSPLWMGSLFRWPWACPSTRRPLPPRRVRRAHLGLEPLEERVTPSVTVTTAMDPATPIAGQLSLREAINMVNSGQVADNTIILPAGTYVNAQGALNVTHSLILQGAGSGTTVLDGSGTDRVIFIDPPAAVNVQISGVTVRNGSFFDDGGGIDVQDVTGQSSVLTVQNCIITDNIGGSVDFGGGGIAANNGDINVIDSQVIDNQSSTFGAGIADDDQGTGNVTVVNSLIANNTAGLLGGGIAILNAGPGKLTITGSTIQDNSVTSPNNSEGGGGIFANTKGDINIGNTTIQGNTSAFDGGGFIAEVASSTNIVFSNDTIDDNQSTQGNGGGIAIETTSNVSLENTTVNGNTAAQAGGGVFLGTSVLMATFKDSTISGNTAGASGGGIEDEAATLTATNSVFDNNKANNGNGGGLDVANGTNQTVGLTNVTFRSNSVAGSFNAGTGFGGGLGASSNSTLDLFNCLFVDNTAGVEGGGLQQIQGTLSIFESQFTGNVASAGGGGALGFDGSAFTISGSTFDNNQASGDGGGVFIVSLSTGASGASLLVNDIFTGNTATQGGAIDVGGTEPVSILNDTITGNSASEAVGGLFAGSPVTLQNSIIAGNSPAIQPDITFAGGLTDNGGNLIGSTSGFFGTLSPTDLVGIDPLLGPLADNGGALAGASSDQQVVQTEALLQGSPAIGKGIANGAPNADERGFPIATPPDIGAFQFQNVPLTVTVTPATPSLTINGSENFTITVRNTGATALPADNSMLTITLSPGLKATGPLTFTLAAVPAGQSQTFTVTTTAVTAGLQILTATLTSSDGNPNNVSGNAVISVVTPPPTPTHTPIGSLTLFAFGFGPTGIDLFEVDGAGDIFAVPLFGGGTPLFLNTTLQLPIAVLADGQLLALLAGSNGQDYIIDIVNPFNTFIEPAVLAALTHG